MYSVFRNMRRICPLINIALYWDRIHITFGCCLITIEMFILFLSQSEEHLLFVHSARCFSIEQRFSYLCTSRGAFRTRIPCFLCPLRGAFRTRSIFFVCALHAVLLERGIYLFFVHFARSKKNTFMDRQRSLVMNIHGRRIVRLFRIDAPPSGLSGVRWKTVSLPGDGHGSYDSWIQ